MLRKKWIIGAALTTAVVLTATGIPSVQADQEAKGVNQTSRQAKNVILMIADGMGQTQRNAIRLSSVGLNKELAMDSMPYSGSVHTNSADPKEFVTDSAASATSIATGVKTYNGAIGMDLNGKPVPTVLEMAKNMGKSTGLVTTSQVTDATPAAFAAHVKNRSDQSEIARQYLENTQPDVILGGGEDYWYPTGNPGKFEDQPAEDPSEGSKGTQGNLVEKAQKLGYTYVTNGEELKQAKGSRILGLFANEEMFQQNTEENGGNYNPSVSLADMTKKAIQTLSNNKKGFFLMVEEEGIDEMAHYNNAELTMKAGREFDKAVAVAKDFARKNADTLVIIVGDHETGSMAVELNKPDESGDGISKEDGPFAVANSDQKFMIDWTTTGHTAESVPLTAMGPEADQLTGAYENTHIHDVIVKAMKGR